MRSVPGLALRHKGYIYRRRVPADLLPTYGKKEEVIGLGTRDFSVARVRAAEKNAEIERKFAEHRASLKSSGQVLPTARASKLSDAEVARFADEHYATILREEPVLRYRALSKARQEPTAFWRGDIVPVPQDMRRGKGGGLHSFWQDVWLADGESSLEGAFLYAVQFNHKQRLARVERLYALGDLTDFLPVAGQIASSEDEQVRVAGRLMLAEIGALKAIISQDETRLRNIEGSTPSSPPASPCTSRQENSAAAPLLSEAAKDWIADKAGSWTPRRKDDCERTIRLFLQVVPDKPINQYGKADALAYKKLLRELPANFTKNPNLRGLGTCEAARKAKELGLPPMSVVNINKLLTIVGSLFNWCCGHFDQVTANPFAKMTVAVKSNARDERDPFTPAELRTIFSAPVYQGCRSPTKWSERGALVLRDSAKFWLPLLGLYTGARLNELCKLKLTDVQCDQGVHFIDLNQQPHADPSIDARLKTASSMRRVPIHRDLVEIGFLRFVQDRRQTGGERLFPELRPDKYGKLADGFSKHFARFLDSLGIKRDAVDFHSFRHSWVDACRNSGVSHELILALKGDAQPGTLARYGDGVVDIRLLATGISQLRFGDLDLVQSLYESCEAEFGT